jgi:hypothetical protein
MLSKAGSKEYFRKHDIDRLIEDIIFELAFNQPDDPKKHIYDFLGRALGIASSPETESPVQSSQGCTFRMFLEHTGSHGHVGRHFFRNSQQVDVSESLINAWHKDAASCLSEIFEGQKSGSKNTVQNEKGGVIVI